MKKPLQLCASVGLFSAQHPASQQVAAVTFRSLSISTSLSNWHCAQTPLYPFFISFSLKCWCSTEVPWFLLWKTSSLILTSGASRYRRCCSFAERPPLCRDKCWILALGTAVSAAGEIGHIGSWLPQFSFSLVVESKKQRLEVTKYNDFVSVLE